MIGLYISDVAEVGKKRSRTQAKTTRLNGTDDQRTSSAMLMAGADGTGTTADVGGAYFYRLQTFSKQHHR